MKTGEVKEVVEKRDGGCCSTSDVNTGKNDPCREQPTDDTSCCDSSETKEVNSEKTGCC